MKKAYKLKLNFVHASLPNQTFKEIQFDSEDTVEAVKQRLSKIFDSDERNLQISFKGVLLGPSSTLESNNLSNHDTLEVKDADPESILNQIDFSDLSSVPKFSISDKEYLKRPDNMRVFKQKMEEDARNAAFFKRKFFYYDEITEPSFTLGSRCVLGDGLRKGEVKFVGLVPDLGPGYWVGVKLDKEEGDSDGTC